MIATVPVVARLDDCPEDEAPEKVPHCEIYRRTGHKSCQRNAAEHNI